MLRPWATGEIAAVLGGDRLEHWADDFPAEGDQVIAGILAAQFELLGDHGHRVIVEREGGRVVGSIGLFWPPAEGAVEIGYGVVPSRRGRGYASEATRALVAHALTAPEVHAVTATADLSNSASVRVLEKAGLRRWSADAGTVRYRTA
ncbi:N-acetyltransferase [Nonomuraea deserti]|uniref:N-acetyltransferase n=1 Tax=Nonomuraea deserti TaxID=1848322 RepID=A0A4R4W9U7_9ACTN|nr:N-acetyltransferase [Nonomuraea deserti]